MGNSSSSARRTYVDLSIEEANELDKIDEPMSALMRRAARLLLACRNEKVFIERPDGTLVRVMIL